MSFEVFRVAFMLGLRSFGGPIAHIGYFHAEYVERRGWIGPAHFADLVALCQMLPGPASSQLGMAIGFYRAGAWGAAMAWLGFTLPSAILMSLFAALVGIGGVIDSPLLGGLKIAAAAVVAQAIYTMWKSLAPDRGRSILVMMAAIVSLFITSAVGQLSVILGAALVGLVAGFRFRRNGDGKPSPVLDQGSEASVPVSEPARGRVVAIVCLVLFFLLLFGLPVLARLSGNASLSAFTLFYRSGALVFGGGHVVLPLLQSSFVLSGQVDPARFAAGYGAVQAMPGPLFSIASFLGMTMGGVREAVLGTVAIFLPSYLLVLGILPFWIRISRNSLIQSVLIAINASVVGLLVSAFYSQIWLESVRSIPDFALVFFLFVGLTALRFPQWLVVIAGALVAQTIALVT